MTSTKRPTSLSLTERDFKILLDIARCGALTSQQIALRHFDGIPVVPACSHRLGEGESPRVMIHSNCERRMKLFKEAGLVRRIDRYQILREGKKPYLYALSPRGAEVLSEYLDRPVEEIGWRKLETRLRPNYVEHLMLTNDVRLAIERAVEEDPALELVTWRDELTLARNHSEDKITYRFADGTSSNVTLNPDAYFLLRHSNGQERHHFVEIDRATETVIGNDDSQHTWTRKIRTYLHYFYAPDALTGQTHLQRRYGTSNARVLTVTTSDRRMTRLLEASEIAGAKERFWFTTHAQAVTPRLTSRAGTVSIGNGREIVVECFSAERPNIMNESIWLIAQKDRLERHVLSETFMHGRR